MKDQKSEIGGQQKKPLKVRSNTITGTAYSQLVSVTITDTDLTLEFVYINPRTTEEDVLHGDVVARVTLPIEAARDLPELIKTTLSRHFDKKGN